MAHSVVIQSPIWSQVTDALHLYHVIQMLGAIQHIQSHLFIPSCFMAQNGLVVICRQDCSVVNYLCNAYALFDIHVVISYYSDVAEYCS